MKTSTLKQKAEAGKGKLYELNGFLVPVVTGSSHEMGVQYGALMVEYMQQAYDVLVDPAVKGGALVEDDFKIWTERAYSTASARNRLFYEGMAEGSGWAIEKVVFLDQIMEYGVYQSKMHSFAGCTSIFAWGDHSTDGNMYTGRNMDWSPTFSEFPTVLTVRKPVDGSYRYATCGWPGMLTAFTALNEHGVYLDVHDGTSMGGSVVYFDRPSVLNGISDMVAESASLEAIVRRLNGAAISASMILNLADESSAVSMECSSLAGNRVRLPENDSLAVVNTFLNPDWGIHKRETVSNSLRRFANMSARLAENKSEIDAERTRELMDLRLFNEDGTFAENGGSTKPTMQDADLTNYQMVTDLSRRQIWLKIPVPDYFVDWTHFDLEKLWA
jgi:hypothetical protein